MQREIFNLRGEEFSVCHWPCAKQDAPVLHWAHANGFNGETYAPLLASLAKDFHVFAWDARGHGHSRAAAEPAQHKNWYIYRDDLLALLQTLYARFKRPLYLAGHSMGGCTTIMASAARPDLVAGLVLVDPVIVPLEAKILMYIRRFWGKRDGGLMLAAMAKKRKAIWPDRATMQQVYTGRGIFATWQPAFLDAYVQGGTLPHADGVQLACSPLWEAANFDSQGHDSATPVKRLATPFTLLTAARGSTTRKRALFEIPRIEKKLMVVPESTHFLPMEYPDIVREEIYARAHIRHGIKGG